jgi:cytosine deaminase
MMTLDRFDLIFRQVQIDSRSGFFDIAVRDGQISEIQPSLSNDIARKSDISCNGMLLIPPFIDAHEHLDCAFMLGENNQSGTLTEAINLYSNEKKIRSLDTVKKHAEMAIIEALYNGTCFIRSHTDLDSIAGQKHLEALLDLRKKYQGLVDIQILACTQYSLDQEPKGEECLRSALDAGADLVGGIPEFEPTRKKALHHMQMVFDVAKDYDVDIDMHIDQTSDPNVRTLEMLADMTIAEDYRGRVTAGHTCALAAYETDYAMKVIHKVKDAGISVVTNPLTNLYLQGRRGGTPTWRGITLVKELISAGVNVACGLDDTKNMFMPFGRMNMLEAVMFTALTAHMTTPDELKQVFQMPTYNAAKILGIEEYGVKVGRPADFIILPVDNLIDAIRLQPMPRYVVRGGRIVAENILAQKAKIDSGITGD